VLDFSLSTLYNRSISKNVGINNKKQSPRNRQKGSIMSNITIPSVGSQFTTQASKVSGTVQEVVMNKSGSARVRLDVNGQPRWTTIK
jgi:hypothetical protein